MAFTSRTALKVVAFATGIYFIKQYMQGAVCESKARLDGKVAIITGSNTGIGKANAEDFVLRGAKVYMACRSVEKAKAAAKEIREKTKVTDDKLIVMKLDLASIASIKKFSEEFHKREDKLDLLINNAGLILDKRSVTRDGFESTFGINHLGVFLLTDLLLDLVKAAAPSRIVTVSSLAHKWASINFDDIMSEKSYFSMSAYGMSKLANIQFTKELAERLEGTGVTTYSVHPGLVRTELGRDFYLKQVRVIDAIWRFISWPFYKDSMQGAQTQICCAVSEQLVNQSGKYYSDCKESEPHEEAKDSLIAKKLWTLSEELLDHDTQS